MSAAEDLRVTPPEARALELLDALCRGRGSRVRSDPPELLRPELIELGARRMAVTCTQFLRDAGGGQERVVLRSGRRARGRLWDPGFAEGFRLRFTGASLDLWRELCARLGSLSRQSMAEFGVRARREARRELRRVVTVKGTDTGDWLLFLMAWRHRHALPLTAEVRDELGRRMAFGSPLVALATLRRGAEASSSREALHRNLQRLLEPRALRMIECLDDVLVPAWRAAIEEALSIRESDEFSERFDELALVLETYLEVLDAARRLDLSRALMRLVGEVVHEVFPGTVAVERRRALAHHAPRTIAERDALLGRVARVVAFGERLVGARDELALERYGDDRYEEARIVLADAERLLDHVTERLTALRIGLSGALR